MIHFRLRTNAWEIHFFVFTDSVGDSTDASPDAQTQSYRTSVHESEPELAWVSFAVWVTAKLEANAVGLAGRMRAADLYGRGFVNQNAFRSTFCRWCVQLHVFCMSDMTICASHCICTNVLLKLDREMARPVRGLRRDSKLCLLFSCQHMRSDRQSRVFLS